MSSIVVIGPHPDDQELGMGGAIALLAAQGHRVTILDLTDGEPTPFGDPATRAREAAEATRLLSPPPPLAPVSRVRLTMPNRRVVHSVEARHAVAGVLRAVRAEVMFVPYFEDAHPDHRAATLIAEDARFDAKLTGQPMPGDGGAEPVYPRWLFHYYATHLRIVPQPSFILDVSAFAQQKRAAMAAYHSQVEANPRNRGLVDRLMQAGAYWGSRIGAAHGEPFFSREPLGLTGLNALAV